jgi:hypothetical protein
LNTGSMSRGVLIAAIAGVVLVISLFLDWVGVDVPDVPAGVSNLPGASAAIQSAVGSASQSLWDLNKFAFVYLLIAAAFAIVPAIVAMSGSDSEIPYFSSGVGFLVSVIGIVCLLAVMFIDFPSGANREIGMWLALAALIATAVGHYLGMQDEIAAEY